MNVFEIIQDKHVQITGAVIISLFLLFTTIEFLYDHFKSKKTYSFYSLIVNFTLSVSQQLTDVFNKIVFIIGYVFVLENFSIQHFMSIPEIEVLFPVTFISAFPYVKIHLSGIVLWLLILIVADFCQYWLHRLSHEVNILWAGHVVHHSLPAYNYSVALRQSFIEGIYTWIFYLPLAILGVSWQLFIMAYAVSLVWQFLVHTQFIRRLGFLEKVLATPSHHRVHHGKNDIYLDKNYGALFIFWDKIFGTFQPETEKVEYGITKEISTHQPLYANTHQHIHILKLLGQTHGLKNKLKVLFARPAFVPEDCQKTVSEIDNSYNPPAEIPSWNKIYVAVNFFSILILGLYSINGVYENQQLLPFIPVAFIILYSHVGNILILENRQWVMSLEFPRIFALLVLLMCHFLLVGELTPIVLIMLNGILLTFLLRKKLYMVFIGA